MLFQKLYSVEHVHENVVRKCEKHIWKSKLSKHFGLGAFLRCLKCPRERSYINAGGYQVATHATSQTQPFQKA